MNRSSMAACFGKCSQMNSPGIAVEIGENGAAIDERPIRFHIPRIDMTGSTCHPQ